MKTIGMIGGMSWESTVTYYQTVNRTVQQELGGFHSAKCLLYSVDFHEIEVCQSAGEWERGGEILADAARNLEKAGADCVLICTNTMHKVADAVRDAVSVPLLHIADCAADELLKANVRRAGLLGTRYTMEQDFYRKRLEERGVETIIPDASGRERLNSVIFDELCLGVVNPASKEFARELVESLQAEGAEGIILGCTEIGLLLRQEDADCPLFDTALIHARSAALFALGK